MWASRMTPSADTLVEGVFVQPPAHTMGVSTTSTRLLIPCTIWILKCYAFTGSKFLVRKYFNENQYNQKLLV